MNTREQFIQAIESASSSGDSATTLQSFGLLSQLTDKQLNRVEQHATFYKLGNRQQLFKQGDSVNNFYLMVSGRIMLSRTSSKGEEKTIEFVTAGKIFAEALMFRKQPHYPVSATALEDSEVIGINAAEFRSMLRESIDTCLLLLGDMSARLHSMIHEIDNLSMHTGACRVATYLMHNTPKGENVFKLNIAKRIIASRLSVKPETFSRILNELHQQGVLTVEGSSIIIHDREALALMCIDDD